MTITNNSNNNTANNNLMQEQKHSHVYIRYVMKYKICQQK